MSKFTIELETAEEAWLLESLAMYSMFQFFPSGAFTKKELMLLGERKAQEFEKFAKSDGAQEIVKSLALKMAKLTHEALGEMADSDSQEN